MTCKPESGSIGCSRTRGRERRQSTTKPAARRAHQSDITQGDITIRTTTALTHTAAEKQPHSDQPQRPAAALYTPAHAAHLLTFRGHHSARVFLRAPSPTKNFVFGLRRARRASENLKVLGAKTTFLRTRTHTHTHAHTHNNTQQQHTPAAHNSSNTHKADVGQRVDFAQRRHLLKQHVNLHGAARLECEQQQQQQDAVLFSRAPARAPAAHSSRAGGSLQSPDGAASVAFLFLVASFFPLELPCFLSFSLIFSSLLPSISSFTCLSIRLFAGFGQLFLPLPLSSRSRSNTEQPQRTEACQIRGNVTGRHISHMPSLSFFLLSLLSLSYLSMPACARLSLLLSLPFCLRSRAEQY